MPILSQKDNPAFFNLSCSIIDSKGVWWVAKVKPRQEKAFAFDLMERNIEYYLPYYEKKTQRSDGKNRKTLLILFQSYIPFVSEDPYGLLKLDKVVTILKVNAQERFKKQLHNVHVANTTKIKMSPVRLDECKYGNFVKIMTGPLKGVEGKFIRYNNCSSIILFIDQLGMVCIETNSFNLEQTDLYRDQLKNQYLNN